MNADSRAPCPPTESMRAAQLMVGTAYESPCRGETPCQRLCPPYNSGATVNASTMTMPLIRSPPLSPLLLLRPEQIEVDGHAHGKVTGAVGMKLVSWIPDRAVGNELGPER